MQIRCIKTCKYLHIWYYIYVVIINNNKKGEKMETFMTEVEEVFYTVWMAVPFVLFGIVVGVV